MLRRLLLGLFSLLIFFSASIVIAKPIHAQTEDPIGKMVDEFDKRRSGNQMNLETWYSGKKTSDPSDPASIGFSQIVLLDLYTRLNGDTSLSEYLDIIKKLIISGKEDGKPIAVIPTVPAKGGGLVGQMGSLIGLAYKSPPVSLSSYLADVRQNIEKRGIVKPAYAQGTGFGFQNLLPILPIWRAFRNVAYFIFILVFVLYGFMIMFRMKINPQNVATFQSAIPKIVLTLILITFAYAIAGFMIDLMFVVFNLILSVFQASGLIASTDNLFVKAGSGQGGILPSFIMSLGFSFIYVPSALINVLTNLPGWASILIGFILSVSGLGLILRIVIVIAIGYSYVKLIFKLFEAYIAVIIQVIFSPLILLQDVLPGSDAFGGWLRNIVANLSVFPVTMIMFLLSFIFMVQPLMKFASTIGLEGAAEWFYGVQNLSKTGTGFAMPLLNNGLITNDIPYVGGGQVAAEGILAVIGFFIILMASKYVDMVRDALKVPAFKYGTAIGEALQMGWRPTGGAALGFAGGVIGEARGQIQKGIVQTAGEAIGFRQQQAAAQPRAVGPHGTFVQGQAPSTVGQPGGPNP